jgi:hypothetical protein
VVIARPYGICGGGASDACAEAVFEIIATVARTAKRGIESHRGI